jgi:NTP pyrophosphatase (non-canonical NTP hydrolase)
MESFEKLLEIARRKAEIDRNNACYSGPETYIVELQKEIEEVIEELPKKRSCYLEDELGDVLWDYLSALLALEKQGDVTVESVLNRAYLKYGARVSGIESGIPWQEIKRKQKQELAKEHASTGQI